MQVRDILKSKGNVLFTVQPDCLLSNCVMMMADNDIGSVVVMDGPQLVGIVTFREVIQILALRHKGAMQGLLPLVGDLQVRAVMKSKPVFATVETELQELRAIMIEHHQRYLPVLEGHVLAGVVSFHDVERLVYEEHTFENRMLKAYISDWPIADASISAGQTVT